MVDGTEQIAQQLTQAAPGEPIRAVIRRGAVFILLFALVFGFTLAQPAFININNLMSILQAVSVVAIIGAGVSVTLAINGFDLSVGAIAASSVMAASYAMIVLGLSAWQTVPLVLAFGALRWMPISAGTMRSVSRYHWDRSARSNTVRASVLNYEAVQLFIRTPYRVSSQ